MSWLDTGDEAALSLALELYRTAPPSEAWGTELWGLEWFSAYQLASPEQRERMAATARAQRFMRTLAEEDHKQLRVYLSAVAKGRKDRRNHPLIREVLRFDSPYRWEREGLGRTLDRLDIQAGTTVADIGAGTGTVSFALAHRVGPQGRVLATDIDRTMLQHIERTARSESLDQLKVVRSHPDDVGLPEGTLDLALMSQCYQLVYVYAEPSAQKSFLASLHAALKPGGRLVVIENDPLQPEDVRYQGLGVAAELVIGQLEANGFRLVERSQPVPQRYVLVLERI